MKIMQVRAAVIDDAAAIARLQVSVWRVAYRGQIADAYLDGLKADARAAVWTSALQDSKQVVLVAGDETGLLGFCSLMPARDSDAKSTTAEIAALYVAAAVWRRGCGSALLTATVEAARQRNFRELTLWVLTSNTPARDFYEARGFTEDGQTKLEERAGVSLAETRYRRSLAVSPHEDS